jgi:isoamylase
MLGLSSVARKPLGATLTEAGVHFAVHSREAVALDLCLYDPADPARETGRVRLTKDTHDTWSAFVPGLREGALYGYRAHGLWAPEHGLWFNARKLLLDPYAKSIQGSTGWQATMQNIAADGSADHLDNGPTAMKSVVVSDDFDWQGDKPLETAWDDTIIYEMHVRGFSKQHPDVPESLRGSYAGLAHPTSLQYLKELGISAVQLLPVHQHLDDGFLLDRDLTNFWGYNTIGFFAPHSEYAATPSPQEAVREFKYMVRELHRTGLEVIIDVVYNHTAEGDENGPMIFLRGLDNSGYYLLNTEARTMNYTGCGNTVNAASPPALRLIMDSLRYWVEVMHVDGFRFDLGATLGRNGENFNRDCAFFQAVAQDPVLSRSKFIAEPWDIGPNGYQVGAFPKPWHELNGRYRDKVRRFWCGDTSLTGSFAKRFSGSQDIFGGSSRPPLASVNFITSHDGFTLRDLWTYNEKHNEANGEGNRDGDSNNHSWNCGVEGETKDAKIRALRRKLTRAMLATTFCSMGVPFLNAGDERYRTQQGNNNAYCQDSPISWIDWSSTKESTDLLNFTRRIISLRKRIRAFRSATFFHGKINPLTGKPDVAWFDAAGVALTHETWHAAETKFFATHLEPPAPGVELREGEITAPVILMFNSSDKAVFCILPEGSWRVVLDTSSGNATEKVEVKTFACAARSVACLVLDPT